MTIPNFIFKNIDHYRYCTALAFKCNGKYRTITYQKLFSLTYAFKEGLKRLGVAYGDTIGIFSENRPEWVIADLAAQLLGIVVVPIHSVFQPKYIKHIIEDSKIKTLIISDKHLFEKLKTCDDLNLEKIIYCSGNKIFGLDKDKFVYFGDLLIRDAAATLHKDRDYSGDPNAIATIVYTSGTVGLPKGVKLAHQNIISNIKAILEVISVSSKDRLLSLLPLSHIFERTAGYYAPLSQGAGIFYAQGYDALEKDLKQSKPSILVGVPRVFEKAYEKIQKNKKAALLCKMPGGKKIVARLIKKKFGGHIRFAVSGGAALDHRIGEFFGRFGIPIIEGYGLTETSPVVCVNQLNWKKFGSCGLPLQNVEVKLAEDGELLVKGESVMRGYHNLPQQTKNAFTKDGFFKTGDLARIDEDGFIYIIGRKKNIIVLSTGRNVQPEEIEAALDASLYIAQVMVVGDGRKMVTALTVPEFEMFQAEGTEIITEKMRSTIQQEIDRLLAEFPEHEQIKKFTLLDKPFELAKDELTPTLKLKRKVIEEHYKDVIDKMYLV